MNQQIVVFDIETVKRPIPESFKKGILDGQVRYDYVTKDPKKIWERLKEKFWTQAEGSRPVAIGFGLVDLNEEKVTHLSGHSSDDERELADFVFDSMLEYGPTHLVGFNSERFDMPILEYLVRDSSKRLANGIKKWNHIDLAKKIPQFFNTYRPLKGSPISAATLFGIPHSGTTGDDVATMWEADKKNKTKKVLEYCLEDVSVTGQLFCKLSKIRNHL